MTIPDPGKSEPGHDASVDDIQADIDATRTELGQTVEALTAKLDVKQQARDKVEDTKDLITDRAKTLRDRGSEVGVRIANIATDDEGSTRPVVPALAFALIAVVVGVVIWRRRQ